MQHQNALSNDENANLIQQTGQEINQAQVQIEIQEIQAGQIELPQQQIIQEQQPDSNQQPASFQQPIIQAEILNNNNNNQQQQVQQQQFQQQGEQQGEQILQQAQQFNQLQRNQQIPYEYYNFSPEYLILQQLNPAQAVALLSVNSIPDEFSFTHIFSSESPCMGECGGLNKETSIFSLPSIGHLDFDVSFDQPARCSEPRDPKKMAALLSRYIPQKSLTLNPDNFCRQYCTNEHFFRQTTYSLYNDNVRIEFFDHIGKFYIRGVLVLELVECIKSYSDIFLGSKFSTMPQMIIYEPYFHSKTKKTNPIRMKAQKNNCPEHPYSLLGYESIFGCCKQSRPFEIFGLRQGKCEILNRRSFKNACESHMGWRDTFFCNYDSCNYPDFKEFEINFKNVQYIDKLKILFGLIHFNMYNKWEHTQYKGRNLLQQIRRIIQKLNGDNDKCSIF